VHRNKEGTWCVHVCMKGLQRIYLGAAPGQQEAKVIAETIAEHAYVLLRYVEEVGGVLLT